MVLFSPWHFWREILNFYKILAIKWCDYWSYKLPYLTLENLLTQNDVLKLPNRLILEFPMRQKNSFALFLRHEWIAIKNNFCLSIAGLVRVCRALFSTKLCWKPPMPHSNSSKLCLTPVERWTQKVIRSDVSVTVFGLCRCPEEKETFMKIVQPFGSA